jgi:hypothetical protein
VSQESSCLGLGGPIKITHLNSPHFCTHLQYRNSRSRSALLFNLDFSFLVSMLQLTGCLPQAFSCTSAVLCNQSHSRLSLFLHYVVTVISIAICLVQPSLHLYLWSTMLSCKSRRSTAIISVSYVILSLLSCHCPSSSLSSMSGSGTRAQRHR